MKKKTLLIAILVLLVFPAIALAETDSTLIPSLITNPVAQNQVAQKTAKKVIARCAIIESKIQVKATNFDNNKIKHLDAYAKVNAKLAEIISKLEIKGVDVSSLKKDLVVLDEKIKKFSDDYAIYIAKLKASQEFVCGETESDFRTSLKGAKTALAQVHKDAVDIRTYYAQNITGNINNIKTAINAQKASSTPEQLSTTTSTTTDEIE